MPRYVLLLVQGAFAASLWLGAASVNAAATAGPYGEIWSQHLNGAVTAQPIRVGTRLVVATNADYVYELTGDGGAVLWSHRLGLPEPAGADAPISCANVAPQLGVLSTPVVDQARGIIYVTSREWDGRRPASAVWRLHALSVADGGEVAGWPVTIAGEAKNSPGTPFDAVHSLQRASLLLLDDHVIAAFAGICDQEPYRGWLAVANSGTRRLTLWTDEPSGSPDAALGGGIWQSGRAPISDRPHEFLVESGNGLSPAPGPAATATAGYANSLLRMRLDGDNLGLVDRFTPYEGDALNSMDRDFGVGAPAVIPATPMADELLFTSSKEGTLYLIDADHLGGRSQGANGGDHVIATAGPYESAFGTPAFWPERGTLFVMGSVAITPNQPQPRLRAFAISPTGSPHVQPLGATATLVGYGSSSPIITSPGNPTLTLVWAVVQPSGGERESQLRAFDPVPVRGLLLTTWEAALPNGSRFTPPTVSNEALYIGSGDGVVVAFRYPGASAFASGVASIDYRVVVVAGVAMVGGAVGVAVVTGRRRRGVVG